MRTSSRRSRRASRRVATSMRSRQIPIACGIRTSRVAENVQTGRVARKKVDVGARQGHRRAQDGAARTRSRRSLRRSSTRAPDGDGWLHEIKFDGYRMLCRIADGQVPDVLAQRQGLDRRVCRYRRTPPHGLPVESAWIDGEVIVNDAERPHQLPGAAERRSRKNRRPTTLVLRVRPALSRRLRPARRCRSPRASEAAARNRGQRPARSATATTSRATGADFFAQACKHGARRHHLEARRFAVPGQRAAAAGRRSSAACGRSSSSAATPTRKARDRASARCCSASTTARSCATAARSEPASTMRC